MHSDAQSKWRARWGCVLRGESPHAERETRTCGSTSCMLSLFFSLSLCISTISLWQATTKLVRYDPPDTACPFVCASYFYLLGVCVCVRADGGSQALVARPEVAAELRASGNGDAEVLDARAVVCSSLEQDYNDSGAYPRLAFKVARLGHAKMLHWMLEQV